MTRALPYQDATASQAAGDTATEHLVFAAGLVPGLEQRVLSFAPGRSAARHAGECEDVLFVLSGEGSIEVDDEPHAIAAETGVFVPAGCAWRVVNDGRDDVVVMLARVHAPEAASSGEVAVLPLTEQDAHDATGARQFRYVVRRKTGCASATQFVGYVPPGRAPDHYHLYDEVATILEGEGFVHFGGESTPLAPGVCIRFNARDVHSVENTGAGVLRILGVFRPAGSPAAAYYPDGALAYDFVDDA